MLSILGKSLLYHQFNFLYLPLTFFTGATVELKPTCNQNNTSANLSLLEKEEAKWLLSASK